MRLGKLLSGANVICPDGMEDIEVSSIVTDSRKVRKGSMFVCIDGLRTDSHKFIKNAVDAGASVVVTESGRDVCVGGAAALEVKNTRRAISFLYNSWYGDPAKKLKIIGVTGTNGKTSVSVTLEQILRLNNKKCGLIGTVGAYSLGKRMEYFVSDPLANMTTPDPEALYGLFAEMLNDGVEYVIMEATSHASALYKLDPINFDVLIYTNLTRDHLDFHKTMENYAEAKANLFERCRIAVINYDDAYAPLIAEKCKEKGIISCSCQEKECDFVASDIRRGGGNGFSMRVFSEKADIDARLDIPLEGKFSPINSLEVIAAACTCGVAESELIRTLHKIKGVSGRMEKVEHDGRADFSIYIDYAHTPDALENALLSCKEIAKKRVLVLFGCGGERDTGKRKQMGQIASKYADCIIITSDNSRSEDPKEIIAEIYKGINKEKEHIIIVERSEAIRYAVSVMQDGDVLLLAGKGHEKYEIKADGKYPFDEKEIVKAAVNERICR